MAGRVVRAGLTLSEADHLAWAVEHVDRRLPLDAQAEHHAVLDDVIVEKQIVAMQVDRDRESALDGGDAGDVIDMCVREKDMANRKMLARGETEQLLDRVARIDDHRLAGRLAADDESVLHERAASFDVDYHVVDDLSRTRRSH